MLLDFFAYTSRFCACNHQRLLYPFWKQIRTTLWIEHILPQKPRTQRILFRAVILHQYILWYAWTPNSLAIHPWFCLIWFEVCLPWNVQKGITHDIGRVKLLVLKCLWSDFILKLSRSSASIVLVNCSQLKWYLPRLWVSSGQHPQGQEENSGEP